MNEKYSPDLLAHYGLLCADCETRIRLIEHIESILKAMDNPGEEIYLATFSDHKTKTMELYVKAVKP